MIISEALERHGFCCFEKLRKALFSLALKISRRLSGCEFSLLYINGMWTKDSLYIQNQYILPMYISILYINRHSVVLNYFQGVTVCIVLTRTVPFKSIYALATSFTAEFMRKLLGTIQSVVEATYSVPHYKMFIKMVSSIMFTQKAIYWCSISKCSGKFHNKVMFITLVLVAFQRGLHPSTQYVLLATSFTTVFITKLFETVSSSQNYLLILTLQDVCRKWKAVTCQQSDLDIDAPSQNASAGFTTKLRCIEIEYK